MQLDSAPKDNSAICKLIGCQSFDIQDFGIRWAGRDYDEAEVIINDTGMVDGAPLNELLSSALEGSICDRNEAYSVMWDGIRIHGDAIVVTDEPLVR